MSVDVGKVVLPVSYPQPLSNTRSCQKAGLEDVQFFGNLVRHAAKYVIDQRNTAVQQSRYDRKAILYMTRLVSAFNKDDVYQLLWI